MYACNTFFCCLKSKELKNGIVFKNYPVNIRENLFSAQQVVPVDAVLRIVLQIGGSCRTGTAKECTAYGAGCGFADNVQLWCKYRSQRFQNHFIRFKICIGGLFLILVRFSQCKDFAQVIGFTNLLSVFVNLMLLFFGDFCGLKAEIAQTP